MKRITALFFSLLLLASSLQARTLTIDVNNRHQTNEGWGVSLCWWANMVGRFDEQRIDSLIDWLVSPEGLNYNIFRYNIGGGDDPLWTNCPPHHMCYPRSGKGYRAEMEGFQDERGGAYHWDRDAAQLKVLKMIKQKRPDAIFEAFSNSAPWWMTLSGCCAGNVKADHDNLDPAYYQDFAEYLITVCKHIKDEYGIEFATLDPFNEPVTDYWPAGGSQEGCHVSTRAQIDFIRVLYPMLKASGLNTVISASDETSVHQSIIDFEAYQKADVMQMVGQWNTHTYQGTAEDKLTLGRLAKEQGIRLWQSETGDGGRAIEGNLKMARRLIEDIKCLEPAAWVDWQYVEERGDQWSLVKSDHIWGSYERHANYYVRQHFSRYIPVGYTFVDVNDADALAAVSPDGKTLVLVTINPGHHTHDLTINLPKGFKVQQAVRSVQDHYGFDVNDFVQKGKVLSLSTPELSVTTLIFNKK